MLIGLDIDYDIYADQFEDNKKDPSNNGQSQITETN